MRRLSLLLLLIPLAACGSSGPSISGDSLAADVDQVEGVSGTICIDTPHAVAGTITDCFSDSTKWRVTFNDDQGHFTIERSY